MLVISWLDIGLYVQVKIAVIIFTVVFFDLLQNAVMHIAAHVDQAWFSSKKIIYTQQKIFITEGY